MAFESLSYRFTFTIEGIPNRWIPLIHLYDPDLPLLPIYYFHVLSNEINLDSVPSDSQRAFGYIEKINIISENSLDVTVVTNKNLNISSNSVCYLDNVKNEIKDRLGINNPVSENDIRNAFKDELVYANNVLVALWRRVVSNAYGNLLPFGRLWDEVLGLTRLVASFYSSGGRKGELIQTHYFLSKFGERIQSAGEVHQVDFYLLPTISELRDSTNPLNSFPNYKHLVTIADKITSNYCSLINIDGISLSQFKNPFGGSLNTEKILNILNGTNVPSAIRPLAIECFNTFDRGPLRTIIFLLMLSDLRNKRLNPDQLSASQFGSIYDGIGGSYQSPKVINIYAQQSFGNSQAMPIDTWISTFFQWPLNVWPKGRVKNKNSFIFSHSNHLGKVERLLWVAAQARKVHSSACNDCIWCVKLSSNRSPRGSNPLACKICLPSIRNVCPAYAAIKDRMVLFNKRVTSKEHFYITTSAKNNTTRNQKFLSCMGPNIYSVTIDDFSPADDPNGIAPYPSEQHDGSDLTVHQFIEIY